MTGTQPYRAVVIVSEGTGVISVSDRNSLVGLWSVTGTQPYRAVVSVSEGTGVISVSDRKL